MFCTIITYVLSIYFSGLSLYYKTNKYIVEVVINFLGSTVVLIFLQSNIDIKYFNKIATGLAIMCYVFQVELVMHLGTYMSIIKMQIIQNFYLNLF